MPQFTIPLEGGGSMTVNASSQSAAINNVKGTGNTPAGSAGGGGGGGGGGSTSSSGPSAANIAAMAQQLLNVGWGGNPNDPAAVIAAYRATATPADVAAMMGGTTTPAGTPTGSATPASADMSGLAQFAAQTSGVTQAQLAQQKAEFDAQLAFARDQMEKLGIPQLQINQTLAALQQSQFQMQLAAANAAQTGWYQPYLYTPPTTPGGAGTMTPQGAPQQTLAAQLQQAQLSGMYNGVPTEAAREFNANLGQQYLATAAQLQGPQNTFQLSNYLRGAQGTQAVPTYLQNLASGVGQAAFTGAGSTAPTPQSAAGLAAQLGGTTSATPGWNYNQTLGAIQQIMGNAQKLAPGSIEQLTPDELQALGSGIGAAGGTLPAFLAQYAASRIGQQAPVAGTSLA